MRMANCVIARRVGFEKCPILCKELNKETNPRLNRYQQLENVLLSRDISLIPKDKLNCHGLSIELPLLRDRFTLH